MKSHATLPDFENFDWVGQKESRIVEQHIAEPAAKDYAKKDMVQQTVHTFDCQGRVRQPGLAAQDQVASQQPANIGQRIPSNSKSFAEFNRIR